MPERAMLEAVRAFNRFYTNRLGVLARDYLETPYSLTEARVLYELGARPQLSASTLIGELGVDAAYLSRILRKFRNDGLVETRPDPADKRSQILQLTEAGRHVHTDLARRARRQIEGEIEHLGSDARLHLLQAMRDIETLLAPASPAPLILLRPHRVGDIGWLVEAQAAAYAREYGWNAKFEALIAEVAGQFLASFNPAREHCWIAEQNGARLGCVMVADGGGAEARLRLLYLEPAARGQKLGRRLVEECIRFARQAGYSTLTLWTNDVLTAALRIYQTAGFRLVKQEAHALFGPPCMGQTWVLDL
ncbi:bifunctional helix-turn-helix transcriptional regulator/GNAT family N-acetyltransferase [Rhizobium halophytocola]|nr:bifunctional helix-turn-helix transcriptional regulator/GNAT family N-acetyltransferase [Rhizobium halophytocola]